ncbi:MAG: type 1 glutamine amidotransferase [Kiritimatiellia bacterium]|jgi:type 1 glutamine amidotransferase
MKFILSLLFTLCLLPTFGAHHENDLWLDYKGKADLPGSGKHITLMAGDEEYRSEETMPMLARLLSERHGFDCRVLFSINPDGNFVDPNFSGNTPGLEILAMSDMFICATRFRKLPDDQAQHLIDFSKTGKPMMGLRTATHGFSGGKFSFGPPILGEGWVAHHGGHKSEACRGIIIEEKKDHPILRGVKDIFAPSDVYTVKIDRLKERGADFLVLGAVLENMKPDSNPVTNKKNDPMMPVVWTRTYTAEGGKPARVVASTMGSSVDFVHEGLRRIVINGVYWGLGMENQIKPDLNIDFVGPFKPTFFGFNKGDFWKDKGLKVSDLK